MASSDLQTLHHQRARLVAIGETDRQQLAERGILLKGTDQFFAGLIGFGPVDNLLSCAHPGVLCRLNLPVLFATVFISNPFTWLPQVAGSIWVGAKLMGMDLMPLLDGLHHRHP